MISVFGSGLAGFVTEASQVTVFTKGSRPQVIHLPHGLTAGDGPAADGVDAVADLVGGGLRERRAAAGPAQLVVDDAMRLAGAVTPGPD